MKSIARLAAVISILLWACQSVAEINVREGRLHAYNVVSNVLMFYNPKYDNRDAKIQKRFLEEMTELQSWAGQQPGDVDLQTMVDSLGKDLAELQLVPEERAQVRPVWVNRLLEQQAHIDEHLNARMGGDNGSIRSIADRLAIHLAMQNLAYQITTFGSVNFYLLEGRTDMMEELDRRVSEGLQQLATHTGVMNNRQQVAFDKLQGRYRFVQPRLTGHQQDWVPNVIAWYCRDMLELAAVLAG